MDKDTIRIREITTILAVLELPIVPHFRLRPWQENPSLFWPKITGTRQIRSGPNLSRLQQDGWVYIQELAWFAGHHDHMAASTKLLQLRANYPDSPTSNLWVRTDCKLRCSRLAITCLLLRSNQTAILIEPFSYAKSKAYRRPRPPKSPPRNHPHSAANPSKTFSFQTIYEYDTSSPDLPRSRLSCMNTRRSLMATKSNFSWHVPSRPSTSKSKSKPSQQAQHPLRQFSRPTGNPDRSSFEHPFPG